MAGDLDGKLIVKFKYFFISIFASGYELVY